MSIEGRQIVVTGGSMGLGQAVAQRLAGDGARTILVSRGEPALREVAAALPGGPHRAVAFDVSSAEAWDRALPELLADGPIGGLVCAAGVLGPVGSLSEVDPARFAQTLAINVGGVAHAVGRLTASLRESGGRVVTFSGGGGTGPLVRYDAYAASKAAVVRLTENIAADGLLAANCIAPGFVATRMHEGTMDAGPEAAGADYYERTRRELAQGGFPAERAAALVAFLLDEASAGITGRLISAQWDPWEDAEFRARLREDPDLGRLRRIDEQFYTRRVEG